MKSMNKLARRGLTVTLAAASVLGMTVAPAAPVLSTAVTAFAADSTSTQTTSAKSILTGQTTNIALPGNKVNDANITDYKISTDATSVQAVADTISINNGAIKVTKDDTSIGKNPGSITIKGVDAGTATFTIKAYANDQEVGSTTYTINVATRANDLVFKNAADNSVVGDTFQAVAGNEYTLVKSSDSKADGVISVYSTNDKVIELNNDSKNAAGNKITFKPKAEGTAVLIITQKDSKGYLGTTKSITVNVTKKSTISATISYNNGQSEDVTLDTSYPEFRNGIKSIHLDSSAVTKAQLNVTPAANTTVSYSSTGKVQVSNTGVVTATGNGEAVITLKATDSSNNTTVEVIAIPVEYNKTAPKYFTAKDSNGKVIAVESKTGSNKADALELSTQDKTSEAITTASNEDQNYLDAVEVLDKNGQMTKDIAYNNGTVSVKNTALKGDNTYYVVFHYRNTGATYRVKVNVTDQKLNNTITTNTDSVKIDVAHPTATITATDANKKGVTYSIVKFVDGKEVTADASTATATAAATCPYFTVTNNGLVTYKADMTANASEQYVIKVTAENAAPKYITVGSKGVQDNAFTLTDANGAAVKDNVTLTLGKDKSYTVKATANDVAAKDTKVTVSNEAVATAKLDEAGNIVITPVAEGTTLVTVSGTVGATSNYANPAPVTFAVTVKSATKPVKAPGKVTGVKVTNKKGQKLNVSYKKVKGAAGYLIKYTTNGKTYKVRTVKTSKNVTRGIKKGKKVSVKVRAYKTSGTKTIYGVYSKTVNKTVDKK